MPVDGKVKGRADAEGRCLQAKSATAGAGLDVPPCVADEPLQSFAWDAAAGTLRLEGGPEGGLCVAAGATMRAANSFKARDLTVESCAATDSKLITWKIVGGGGDTQAEAAASTPPADVDCNGSWSSCTAACEAAAARTWTQAAAPSGSGAACPEVAPNCAAGEGACPPKAEMSAGNAAAVGAGALSRPQAVLAAVVAAGLLLCRS